jgi:predicted dehydrogenase
MYEAQMEHFLDSVVGKKRPEPDGRLGVQSMVLLDAIYESIRTGSSVSISKT